MQRLKFTRSEAALIATAAALLFSRVFGFSVVLPDFRRHYSETLAADPVLIGTAIGAYGLTMALIQFPSGWLSDRIGRRAMLLAATVLFVLGSLVAAFAETAWMLIAARLIQGLGAVGSIAMAGVGERVAPERRTLAMALAGMPAAIGFVVGVGLGPALYPIVSMQGLFFLTAAVGLVAGIPLLWVRFAAPHERPVAAKVRVGRQVVGFALAGFATSWFLTTTLFFLPETSWRSFLPMLVVALGVIGLVSTRADRRAWTWQPAGASLLVLALSAPLLVLAGPTLALLFGMAFFAGYGVLFSTIPSQVSRIAGPYGGRGHGFQNVVTDLGTFVAGPIAGLLVNDVGVAFAVAGALAVTAVMLLYSSSRPQRIPAKPVAS